MEAQLVYSKTTVLDDTQVDRFGRMRPSALLEVLQTVAVDHAKALGVGREALDPKGLFWAVVRQTLEIHRMPRVGETIITETWPGPPSHTAFPRYITGRTKEGEMLFRVVALWLFMDVNSRAMVLPGASGIEVPGITRGGELMNPTGIAPRQYPNLERRRVRYSELDCNGHLSNTKYLNWMEDLLPSSYHENHVLSRLHICYINEALEGQEIELNWALEDNHLCVDGRRELGAHRVFAVRAEYKYE